MESHLLFFSLPECSYDELHPILPSNGSLLGADDVLAQFLDGDEPLEEPDLNGPTTLHCEICSKQFDNAKKYYGHLRVHSKDNLWRCDKCPNEKFSTKQQLMKHSLIHKPLGKVWRCPQCTMAFEALWRLQQHLFAQHLQSRPHKCDRCEKAFYKKSDLKKHKNVHDGIRNHHCTVCTSAFKDKSNLKKHMLTHNDERPFCCPGCGNKYKQLASMKRHMQNCNAYHNLPETIETIDKTTRKNYCKVCGMIFQYRSGLIEHMRVHTNNSTRENVSQALEKDKTKTPEVDKPIPINLDTHGTVDKIVDDILSVEDDYRTMSTQNEMLNVYHPIENANTDNLMQYELLKEMNHLHMLDDELFFNDIDLDSLQTNDIECSIDKNILFDFADSGRSLDQDIMNSLYSAKVENLADGLLDVTETLPVQSKPNDAFVENTPTSTAVNECVTIFESDVDLEASTNLAANLNQLIGENNVQYISTEDDDTFIISMNSEIDAEQLTDMLNIGAESLENVKKKIADDDIAVNETQPLVVKVQHPEISETVKETTKDVEAQPKKKVKVKKRWLFVCRTCNKLFATKDNYRSHVASHEPSLRRFACSVCGQRFGYRSTRNRHERARHTPMVHSPHACHLCHRTYKAAWLLKCHMERDHEGITQYKCDYKQCDKKFYKKYDLTKHKRSHSGERPYKCEICERKFSQISHLRRHAGSVNCTKFAKKKKRPVSDASYLKANKQSPCKVVMLL